MHQNLAQIAGILVVLQRMIEVDRSFGSGLEHIGDSLAPELGIDECLANPIPLRRAGGEFREGKRKHLARGRREFQLGLSDC